MRKVVSKMLPTYTYNTACNGKSENTGCFDTNDRWIYSYNWPLQWYGRPNTKNAKNLLHYCSTLSSNITSTAKRLQDSDVDWHNWISMVFTVSICYIRAWRFARLLQSKCNVYTWTFQKFFFAKIFLCNRIGARRFHCLTLPADIANWTFTCLQLTNWIFLLQKISVWDFKCARSVPKDNEWDLFWLRKCTVCLWCLSEKDHDKEWQLNLDRLQERRSKVSSHLNNKTLITKQCKRIESSSWVSGSRETNIFTTACE